MPKGFPLPWEVATAYRLMITLYKLNFSGSWELQKPRKPDFVIVPPLSDFTNLAQPPDFSGVSGDNPIEDVCDVFVALIEWIVKEIGDAITLIGDLIKMALSPLTYPIRLGLYELAMRIWDIAMKTHDVMAHTGFLLPHGEQRYPDDGELRLPNEIDLPLITLGGDDRRGLPAGARRRHRPVRQPGHRTTGSSSGTRCTTRTTPTTRCCSTTRTAASTTGSSTGRGPTRSSASSSRTAHNTAIPTPTETYDPSKSGNDPNDIVGPAGAFKPMRPGPYPEGTTPDQVFFRTDAPVEHEGRAQYESARTPWQTDLLNEQYIGRRASGSAPSATRYRSRPISSVGS